MSSGFTKKLKIYSDIVDIADRHQVEICFAVLKKILMASNNVVKAFRYLHVDFIWSYTVKHFPIRVASKSLSSFENCQWQKLKDISDLRYGTSNNKITLKRKTTTNHRQRLISSKAKQIRWQMVFSTYCLLFLRSIYIFSTSTVSTSSRWLEISFQNEVFGADAYNCDVNNENCALAYQGMFLDLLPNQQQSPPGFLHVSQVFQRSVCSQSTTGSPEDHCRKKHTLSLGHCHCAEHREFAFRGTFEWDCSRRKTVSSAQHKRNRAAEWWRDDELQCKQPRTAGCYFACPCPGAECVHGGWREECGAMGNAPVQWRGALPAFLQEMLTAYKVNFPPLNQPFWYGNGLPQIFSVVCAFKGCETCVWESEAHTTS